MIINKRIDGEYKQVASVDTFGNVKGDSHIAESLKEELNGDGVYVPGFSDDREECFLSEGPEMLLYLDNKYSTGYYSSQLEKEDYEDMAEFTDREITGDTDE